MITGSDNTPAYLTEDAWERTENSMLSGDQPDNVRMVEDKPSPYAFVGKPHTQTANDRRLERAKSMQMILKDIARTPLEVTAEFGLPTGLGRRKQRRHK